MRTTIDIDGPILKEIKRLQKQQGRSLGRIVSDLLARSLAQAKAPAAGGPGFNWISRPMQARVDLADKQALQDAMDDEHR